MRSLGFSLLLAAISFQVIAQPSTDIWLYRIDTAGNIINDRTAVTDRDGYDSQPQFHMGSILYTSDRNEQTDIYSYEIATGSTKRITYSNESEYSPIPMPGGKYVSVIMVEKDGKQRLWKYNLRKRERKVVLVDLEPIGYHVWYSTYDLGLFVLGEPNSLYIADSYNSQSFKLATDIGRSLINVPDSIGQFSYIQNNGDKKDVMIAKGRLTSFFAQLPDNTQDFCWLDGSRLLTGVGSQIMRYDPSTTSWSSILDLAGEGVTEISRLARSNDGKYLALVVTVE